MSILCQNAITKSLSFFNMGLTPPPPLSNVKKLQIWKRGISLIKVAAKKGALTAHKWLAKTLKSINKCTIKQSKYVKYISVSKTFKLVNLITLLPAEGEPCPSAALTLKKWRNDRIGTQKMGHFGQRRFFCTIIVCPMYFFGEDLHLAILSATLTFRFVIFFVADNTAPRTAHLLRARIITNKVGIGVLRDTARAPKPTMHYHAIP